MEEHAISRSHRSSVNSVSPEIERWFSAARTSLPKKLPATSGSERNSINSWSMGEFVIIIKHINKSHKINENTDTHTHTHIYIYQWKWVAWCTDGLIGIVIVWGWRILYDFECGFLASWWKSVIIWLGETGPRLSISMIKGLIWFRFSSFYSWFVERSLWLYCSKKKNWLYMYIYI